MEVYRIKPELDKYYETVEYTRKEGKWPDEKYYTIIKPLYVGKFLNETISGYGDNKIVCYHFENDIKIIMKIILNIRIINQKVINKKTKKNI